MRIGIESGITKTQEAQRRREASGDEEAAATRSEERGATRGAARRESGAALPEKMAGRSNDSQQAGKKRGQGPGTE